MMERMTAREIPFVLEWLLRLGREEFQEETKDYGKGFNLDLMDACELMDLYQEVGRRLRDMENGRASHTPVLREPMAEEIVVNRDYRIFLPGRNGMEVNLRPLVKTVFLLFLKHPEGISLKSIGAYRDEMKTIYSRISRRADPVSQSDTVDRLADAMDNSIHENCSRLNRRLSEYFQGSALENLQVRGEYGGLRRIRHDRMLVRWESD